MPFAYKQVEIQKMEGVSKDTLRHHIDRFVPIYIQRGKKVSKRFLTREDSLIYKAGLVATKQQRMKAFCQTAFKEEYKGGLPATEMCIIAHYDDGRIFDKIYFRDEEMTSLARFVGLQPLLTKLKMYCMPPRETHKYFIQTLDEEQLDHFDVGLAKKRGYKRGSRIIIDGFGRKSR